MTAVLAAFVAATVVITISPGPDTLVVLRNGAAGGRRAAVATAAGVLTACSVLLVAVVVGLAALVRSSEVAYAVLRYAGAAYLVYLGVRSILTWKRAREPIEEPPPVAAASAWSSARQGFLTCILNPKLIAFLLAFFPQFTVPDMAPVAGKALLAAIFLLVAALWFALIVAAIGWMGPWLARPHVRGAVTLASGVLLVVMGLLVVVQR